MKILSVIGVQSMSGTIHLTDITCISLIINLIGLFNSIVDIEFYYISWIASDPGGEMANNLQQK